MPYRKYLITFLLILPSLYLKSALLIYFYILAVSMMSLVRNDRKTPLVLFFILVYLLPFDLLSGVVKLSFGSKLDNYFVWGLPLYICFPIYFMDMFKVNKQLRLILLFFFVVFFVSTIFLGLTSIFINTNKVQLAASINYFNGFLLAILAYRVFAEEKDFLGISFVLIELGFLIAISGIIQYVFKFYFFESWYAKENYGDFSRLITISYPDPVDLIPFFIVPIAFGFNYIFSDFSRNKPLVFFYVVVMLFALILTWARWGYLCIGLILIMSILLNKKITSLFNPIIIIIVLMVLVVYYYLPNFVSAEQYKRLEKNDTLIYRFYLWSMGLKALKEHFFLGVGLGNSSKVAFENRPDTYLFGSENYQGNVFKGSIQSLHQFYLDWVLSMGMFIILGLIMLYFSFIRNARYVLRHARNPQYTYIINSASCIVAGLSLFWVQNSSSFHFLLFMCLAISFGIRDNLNRTAALASPRRPDFDYSNF